MGDSKTSPAPPPTNAPKTARTVMSVTVVYSDGAQVTVAPAGSGIRPTEGSGDRNLLDTVDELGGEAITLGLDLARIGFDQFQKALLEAGEAVKKTVDRTLGPKP